MYRLTESPNELNQPEITAPSPSSAAATHEIANGGTAIRMSDLNSRRFKKNLIAGEETVPCSMILLNAAAKRQAFKESELSGVQTLPVRHGIGLRN